MDREAMIAALIFGGTGSGGGGGADAPFVIKFTMQNNIPKSDKTATEINDALAAGKPIIALATEDVFGGSASYIVQLELANTGLSPLGNCIQFTSRAAVFEGGTTPTAKAYRLMGSYVLNDYAWAGYTEPIYLPRVTNSDNGKVLGVDNGAWGAVTDKGAPFDVEFTITGLPSGTSYPVSVPVTLAAIYAAVRRGDRVFASVAWSASDYAMGALSVVTPNGNDGFDYVGYDINGLKGGTVVLGHAVIQDDGNGEVASLDMVPLSAAQMTYDSATQTLAIVDPLA